MQLTHSKLQCKLIFKKSNRRDNNCMKRMGNILYELKVKHREGLACCAYCACIMRQAAHTCTYATIRYTVCVNVVKHLLNCTVCAHAPLTGLCV